MHNRRLLLAGCFVACICIAVCQSHVSNEVGSGGGSSGEIPGEGSGLNSIGNIADPTLVDDEDVRVEKASKAGNNAEISGEGSGFTGSQIVQDQSKLDDEDVIVESTQQTGSTHEIPADGSGPSNTRQVTQNVTSEQTAKAGKSRKTSRKDALLAVSICDETGHPFASKQDVKGEKAPKAGNGGDNSGKSSGLSSTGKVPDASLLDDEDVAVEVASKRVHHSLVIKHDVEGEKAPKAASSGDNSGESSGLSSSIGNVPDASLIDDEDVTVEIASTKGGNNHGSGTSHGEGDAGMGSSSGRGSGSGSSSGDKDTHDVDDVSSCIYPQEEYLKNHLPTKQANDPATTLPITTTSLPTTIIRQLHTTRLSTSSLAISESEKKTSRTSSNQGEVYTAATEKLPEIIVTSEESYKTDATHKKTLSLTTLPPTTQELLAIKNNHIPVVATKDFQNDLTKEAEIFLTVKPTPLPKDITVGKKTQQSKEGVAKDPNMIAVSLPNTANNGYPVVTEQQRTAQPHELPFEKRTKQSKEKIAKDPNIIPVSLPHTAKTGYPVVTEQQRTAQPKDIPLEKKTKPSKEKIAKDPNMIPVSLPEATKTSQQGEVKIGPPYKAKEQPSMLVAIIIGSVALAALVVIVILIALKINRRKSSSDFYDRPSSRYKRLAEV